jgi:hypothetical protein
MVKNYAVDVNFSSSTVNISDDFSWDSERNDA